MIRRELSPQALIIEDAQTEIRLAIKRGYFDGKTSAEINKSVNTIIAKAGKDLTSKDLKKATQKSLRAFANRAFAELRRRLGLDGKKVMYQLRLAAATERGEPISYKTDEKGIALQEYNKDYIRKVRGALEKIAEMDAIDPNDFRGRNSLRNLAEMTVRYEAHGKNISSLKSKGVNLVVCSVHADCSDRCFPHQGKIYSLDGSTGNTKDGRKYVPLEVATDIYHTTKSGKVYKNGLLGFNCRHYLYEYKDGMAIPTVSREEQQKEDKINQQQRAMERRVRYYRERAVMLRDVDRAAFSEARRRAIQANKQYQAFSHASGRAYYPDRVKIIM